MLIYSQKGSFSACEGGFTEAANLSTWLASPLLKPLASEMYAHNVDSKQVRQSASSLQVNYVPDCNGHLSSS